MYLDLGLSLDIKICFVLRTRHRRYELNLKIGNVSNVIKTENFAMES
jgi:hypothetical protein